MGKERAERERGKYLLLWVNKERARERRKKENEINSRTVCTIVHYIRIS